ASTRESTPTGRGARRLNPLCGVWARRPQQENRRRQGGARGVSIPCAGFGLVGPQGGVDGGGPRARLSPPCAGFGLGAPQAEAPRAGRACGVSTPCAGFGLVGPMEIADRVGTARRVSIPCAGFGLVGPTSRSPGPRPSGP